MPTSETRTWTGSGVGRFNEDYASICLDEGCAVLVDGATGLTKVNLVPGESDAAWYARHLANSLVGQLSDPSCPTVDAYVRAGNDVAEAYRRFDGAMDLARIDEPNGSVASLRWQGERVEVSLLGDCTAVALMRDGIATVLQDDTLTKLDEENYARMFAYATEHDTTMAEARKALNPRFIENRLKMNEPGGYWAADISCRGMAQVQSWYFAYDDVAALFACSDGYAAAVDMGVVADAGGLASRVASGEGQSLGEALREAEQEDAGCWRVHRSKTSDDATYVLIRLAGHSE